MKRQIQGLKEIVQASTVDVPDGLFLVRVDKAQYRWHAQKPFYALRFFVLKPHEMAGRAFNGRLYCTPKALWKLGWFLRDFVYDPDLLGQDEVDERRLYGLCGIVKISRTTVNGTAVINFDGFAPASQWEQFSTSPLEHAQVSGEGK